MQRLVAVLAAAVFVTATVSAPTPAFAAPTASVSPASGPPGATVKVSAGGFDPRTRIDVFFDTSDVALVVSNASGAVTVSFPVPSSAQPGKHWITLDETKNHAAAQAAYTVVVNWLQGAWGPSWRGFNPYENTLNPGNVAQLTHAWSATVSPYGNPKPFVVMQHVLYVFDESEVLHAYTTAGKQLWTAKPGTTFRFAQAAPVAANGLVYVGDATGLVKAYRALCRTDGRVCANPVWSVNLATPVNGGLTYRNGSIYAPGNDGVVHVLNAATGAARTSITTFFSGAITAPVAFGADGTAYIVQGNDVSQVSPGAGGGGSGFGSGVTLSQPAVGNGSGYVTSSDGNLDQVPGGWTAPLSGTGCSTAPVLANGVVYAAGCSSIGAYDAGTGTQLWSISVPQSSQGMSVANGVLYACWGYRVHMYDAGYGGLLGSTTPCAGAPEIVEGAVYSIEASLFASTLNAATTTAASRNAPDPRLLLPASVVPARTNTARG